MGQGPLSLARALSKFGVCSRKEAVRWIADGRVGVGGAVERSPERWIDPRHDRVTVDGRVVGDSTERIVLAFRFTPIPDSANRWFYFVAESPDGAPGDAITLWATMRPSVGLNG